MSHYLLASGSQYRAELLKRLNRPFQQLSPDVDESELSDESPPTLAGRLAEAKANAPAINEFIAKASTPPIIIASDQVAALGDQILGKPGTLERARLQLSNMQGQSVSFHTSLHMRNLADDTHFIALDTTVARLRKLSSNEIERYLNADNPLDCAGSFKVESLGISLFSGVETTDPTALVGLPMIAVCEGLRQFGLDVP
ncbi:Maf family nucleotide pyrophosphatase [Granulosicoccus sp.]|nr:Maf family protein [Granulosicoccus sp.]MDB4223731.1 Maf family nucleotide pyrophosphatase [Granulosicoccus sp.]